MHFRPGFLLLAASLLMQIFLLGYVWQKDVVHTGIQVSALAIPFVLLLILGAIMALRSHSEKRDYILLIISALFGCSLPWFFQSTGQLLQYGDWIRAGMFEKPDNTWASGAFLLIQCSLVLVVRFIIKRREETANSH
jgi:hypothetical protein